MGDDFSLLRRYLAEGSEDAFRELVQRHLPLVYSAALRQVAGDRQLAEDVSQHVFAELARCAGSLSSDVILPGWLYRATRFTAAKVVRSERRRRAHEAAASLEQETERMNATQDADWPDWDALCSQLDEAINELGENERDAILLRFFQRLDFRAIGAALKTSDDTAQKRVSRALDKLRLLLVSRGIALSGAALGALLASNAVAAPPPGLTARIVARLFEGGGLAAAAAGGSVAAGSSSMWLTTRVLCGVGALLAVGVALAAWYSRQETGRPASIPPGLVSWWTADGNAADQAGKNHGAIDGNITYVAGVVGQAFGFDGREGTRIRVPHSPSLNLTNEITLEFWFRPDEDSMMGSLVVKRTEATNETMAGNLVNYGFSMGRLHLDHQYGICQFFNDPEQKGGYHSRVGEISLLESLFQKLNLPPVSARFASKENLFEQSAFFPTQNRDLSVLRGQWHHLAGTFKQVDSKHVRMTSYFDGEVRNRIVLAGCLANTVNDAPLSIGGFPSSPFKGCIDEVRIFDRELTAKEIKDIIRLAASSKGK